MQTVTRSAPSTAASDRPAWRDALDGAQTMAPLLAGYLPLALTVGAAVAAEGPWLPRWLGTFAIYGGSAQLVVLQLLDSGAGTLVVVLAGLVTHARLLAYSSAIAPEWRDARPRFRAAAAAVLIEPTWALATARAATSTDPAAVRRYYLGAGATLTVGWGAFVTAGMLTGSLGGAIVLLAPAVPLSLVAVVTPQVQDRSGAAVVAAAAVVALLAADLPAGTGVLAAMGAGVVAGRIAGEAR